MRKGLIITGVILGAFLITAISLYSYINKTRSQGITYETGLNAQYLDNQNELSAFKSSFYEQIGVAGLKSDKIDKILEDAVKGRYEGKMQPGTGGAMFSAISEAYPNITGQLDLFDRIVDFVKSGREAYKQKQSALLSQLKDYDKWRQDGIVRSIIVKNVLGIPSDALEARIGTSVTHGAAARDQMYLIVLTSDTKKAYETGIDEPMKVPGAGK